MSKLHCGSQLNCHEVGAMLTAAMLNRVLMGVRFLGHGARQAKRTYSTEFEDAAAQAIWQESRTTIASGKRKTRTWSGRKI